jgi:hypothetical protein
MLSGTVGNAEEVVDGNATLEAPVPELFVAATRKT